MKDIRITKKKININIINLSFFKINFIFFSKIFQKYKNNDYIKLLISREIPLIFLLRSNENDSILKSISEILDLLRSHNSGENIEKEHDNREVNKSSENILKEFNYNSVISPLSNNKSVSLIYNTLKKDDRIIKVLEDIVINIKKKLNSNKFKSKVVDEKSDSYDINHFNSKFSYISNKNKINIDKETSSIDKNNKFTSYNDYKNGIINNDFQLKVDPFYIKIEKIKNDFKKINEKLINQNINKIKINKLNYDFILRNKTFDTKIHYKINKILNKIIKDSNKTKFIFGFFNKKLNFNNGLEKQYLVLSNKITNKSKNVLYNKLYPLFYRMFYSKKINNILNFRKYLFNHIKTISNDNTNHLSPTKSNILSLYKKDKLSDRSKKFINNFQKYYIKILNFLFKKEINTNNNFKKVSKLIDLNLNKKISSKDVTQPTKSTKKLIFSKFKFLDLILKNKFIFNHNETKMEQNDAYRTIFSQINTKNTKINNIFHRLKESISQLTNSTLLINSKTGNNFINNKSENNIKNNLIYNNENIVYKEKNNIYKLIEKLINAKIEDIYSSNQNKTFHNENINKSKENIKINQNLVNNKNFVTKEEVRKLIEYYTNSINLNKFSENLMYKMEDKINLEKNRNGIV